MNDAPINENIISLAKRLNEVAKEKEQLEALVKQFNEEKEKIEDELYQKMDDNDIQRFNIEGIGTFYKYTRLFSKVVNVEAANNFLKEQGVFEEIMEYKPKLARLNEYMENNYVNNGVPVPETEIGISVTLSPKIGRRSK